MKLILNTIHLGTIYLNKLGEKIKKIIRYVEDGEVPDTHTQMYDSESTMFFGVDAKFNVKKEQ